MSDTTQVIQLINSLQQVLEQLKNVLELQHDKHESLSLREQLSLSLIGPDGKIKEQRN